MTPRKNQVPARVQFELDVLASPDSYVGFHYAPRASERTPETTLESVEAWAVERIKTPGNIRGVMVYAIKDGHQVLLKTLDPKGRWIYPVTR